MWDGSAGPEAAPDRGGKVTSSGSTSHRSQLVENGEDEGRPTYFPLRDRARRQLLPGWRGPILGHKIGNGDKALDLPLSGLLPNRPRTTFRTRFIR